MVVWVYIALWYGMVKYSTGIYKLVDMLLGSTVALKSSGLVATLSTSLDAVFPLPKMIHT